MTLTKGEYRVGISFNPSADDKVGRLKSMAAAMIDFIEGLPDGEAGQHAAEVRRLKALAQTHVEDAAMWAVKAATKPSP